MKIHVIDNAGQIQPLLLAAEDDVTFYNDEIRALNAAEVSMPGLVLLDIAVRGDETAAYIELLLLHSPCTSVVVIGDDLPDAEVLGCLLAGAKGYLDRWQLPTYIGKLVHVIAKGEAWVSRRMTALLLGAIRRQKLSILNQLAASGSAIVSPTGHSN